MNQQKLMFEKLIIVVNYLINISFLVYSIGVLKEDSSVNNEQVTADVRTYPVSVFLRCVSGCLAVKNFLYLEVKNWIPLKKIFPLLSLQQSLFPTLLSHVRVLYELPVLVLCCMSACICSVGKNNKMCSVK